ncbi:MAG: methyltransferase domain-containing protein [Cyanobacteria bacterium TGS_CYA1]|nr:methyltransferase domain-containing protein [Cyanobacteria bacterium TGS_CYA1]
MNSYCIQDFLDELKLKPFESLHQFWRELDNKYPPQKVKELERAYAKLEENDEASFYEAIFADFDLALTFSRLRIDLYKATTDWLCAVLGETMPKHILDAGCGNGILTCYLAKVFPKARVTGIDISEAGIEQARKLAEQLSLTNITFEVGDIKDYSFVKADTNDDTIKFDLILTVAALEVTSPFLIKQLHRLNRHLDDNGIMLNFEKISNPQIQKFFVQALDESNLQPDLEKSGWLKYENADGDEINLPAFASYKKADKKPVSSEILQSFLLTESNLLSELDLSFKQEALCELLFNQLNPKELIRAYKADFHDGSGTYNFEQWQSGPFALLYEHTDQGYRNLRIKPLYLACDFSSIFDQWLEQTANYADLEQIK